jgi:hypothetical protein
MIAGNVNILGVDPGLRGALVLLSPEGRVLQKHVMPVREEGGLDLQGLGRLLSRVCEQTQIALLERPNGTMMTRGKGPFAGNRSVASEFNFGKTCGQIEGMLAAFQIPYVLVAPVSWSSALYKGQDRKLPSWHKALVCAERFFPIEDFRASTRAQKPHDGIVDAALLATFGRMALERSPLIPEKWHGLGAGAGPDAEVRVQ